MKRLKWLSEERILPGIAHVTHGQEFFCEDDAARSFVDQKLAEYVRDREPETKSRKEV